MLKCQIQFIEWLETCKCECRLDAIVLIINNIGIKIDADVNGKK